MLISLYFPIESANNYVWSTLLNKIILPGIATFHATHHLVWYLSDQQVCISGIAVCHEVAQAQHRTHVQQQMKIDRRGHQGSTGRGGRGGRGGGGGMCSTVDIGRTQRLQHEMHHFCFLVVLPIVLLQIFDRIKFRNHANLSYKGYIVFNYY